MGEKVSQEVRAPFRVMPIRSVSDPTAVSPLFMMLAPIGAAILAFGTWDLIHALPKYSMSVVIMLFGAALLWVGVAHIRARRHRAGPVGYWIGFDSERLFFAR